MKRFLLITLLFLLTVFCVSGQQIEDLYYKTFTIVKIYGHQLGYKVYYLRENADVASFYLPAHWFYEPAGRGNIVWVRWRIILISRFFGKTTSLSTSSSSSDATCGMTPGAFWQRVSPR